MTEQTEVKLFSKQKEKATTLASLLGKNILDLVVKKLSVWINRLVLYFKEAWTEQTAPKTWMTMITRIFEVTEIVEGGLMTACYPVSHHWSGRWPPVSMLLWCHRQFVHTYILHGPRNLLVSPTSWSSINKGETARWNRAFFKESVCFGFSMLLQTVYFCIFGYLWEDQHSVPLLFQLPQHLLQQHQFPRGLCEGRTLVSTVGGFLGFLQNTQTKAMVQ